jgi:hypothetical protein
MNRIILIGLATAFIMSCDPSTQNIKEMPMEQKRQEC